MFNEQKTTMSSKEIAEMTGKQHKDVLEAIRNMEDAWEKVNQRKFPLVDYTDAKGEKRPMYQLSKTECLYVATKFNDEARARLILRWEELETKSRIDFTDPSTILQLAQNWKDEADRREAAEIMVAEQEIKLLLQEPKVEFHDQVMLTEDGILITVIAKEFGWSASRMNKKLIDLKILYKAGETYVLHAKYQNLGYAKTKTHKYVDSEGKLHSAINLVWTQKGRFFIHETIKKLMQNS